MQYAVLAQSTVTFNGQTIEDGGAFAGAALVVLLVVSAVLVPLIIVSLIGLWKVFEKAGVAGWKALIPIYSGWVTSEIAGKPGWWGIVGVGGLIPYFGFVATIIAFVLSIFISLEIAKAFKRSEVFAVFGLLLFPVVGYIMLGFGKDQYTSPLKQTPAAGPAPAGSFAVPNAAAVDQAQPASPPSSTQPPTTPAA